MHDIIHKSAYRVVLVRAEGTFVNVDAVFVEAHFDGLTVCEAVCVVLFLSVLHPRACQLV